MIIPMNAAAPSFSLLFMISVIDYLLRASTTRVMLRLPVHDKARYGGAFLNLFALPGLICDTVSGILSRLKRRPLS